MICHDDDDDDDDDDDEHDEHDDDYNILKYIQTMVSFWSSRFGKLCWIGRRQEPQNHQEHNQMRQITRTALLLFRKIPSLTSDGCSCFLSSPYNLRRNVEDEAEITFGEIRSERMASGDPRHSGGVWTQLGEGMKFEGVIITSPRGKNLDLANGKMFPNYIITPSILPIARSRFFDPWWSYDDM